MTTNVHQHWCDNLDSFLYEMGENESLLPFIFIKKENAKLHFLSMNIKKII